MFKAVIILTIVVYAGILSIPAFISIQNKPAEAVKVTVAVEAQEPVFDEYGYGDAIAEDEVVYLSQGELKQFKSIFVIIGAPETALTVLVIFATFLCVVGYLSVGFIITFWMMHA